MSTAVKITYTDESGAQTIEIPRRLVVALNMPKTCAQDVQQYLDKTCRIYWGQDYWSISLTLLRGPESFAIFNQISAVRVEIKLYYEMLFSQTNYITCKAVPKSVSPYFGGGLSKKDLILDFVEVEPA